MTRLGVLGHPVAHSRSPELHAQFARQVGLEIDYQKLDVAPGHFATEVIRLQAEKWVGCNVTVPFKPDAHDVCTTRSREAEVAGVVNTLVFHDNGAVEGHNTDGPGLVADMTTHQGWDLDRARLLILGAGGATQGVLGALLETNPASIHVWNRTHARAEQLVHQHDDARVVAMAANDLESHYDFVLHASAAGLQGQRALVPVRCIGSSTRAYDLSYSTEPTPFLNWASSNVAAACADGLGMLIEQAALAFEIWFGKLPSTTPVREAEGLAIDNG